ncbi:MAG: GNAT family N-acetyltransferase [Prevotella sp.]|nr:GNAT family N-acetyltransferase [Prevotella sp.]
MIFGEYDLIPLSTDTEIKPLKCTDNDLNDFLQVDAKKYFEELLAVTYLLEDTSHDKTVAYFNLLTDMMISNPDDRSEWNRLNRSIHNSKRRSHYPAVKIGRLAVSEEYIGKGIGRDILRLIKFMLTHENIVGCRFLTVDAYKNAVGFYEKLGFRIFSVKEDSPTCPMYYDLKRGLTEEQ